MLGDFVFLLFLVVCCLRNVGTAGNGPFLTFLLIAFQELRVGAESFLLPLYLSLSHVIPGSALRIRKERVRKSTTKMNMEKT